MSRERRARPMAMSSRHDEKAAAELRRGPWTLEEDNLLMSYIACRGEGRWNLLARCSGLKRTGKSCRLRWLNYLKPDIKRGNLTPEEQLLILELHSKWGNRWSRIAQHLPGRTDNEIKNYWRTRVQKQARQLKVDANSTVFRDAVRCYWMPRLFEKMASASTPPPSSPHHQPLQRAHGHGHDHHAVMAASSPINNLRQYTNGSSYHQHQYYPIDPSPSTSTSGSAAALPPVPCFSEPNWDQYSGELDGAGVLDSAALGSLGLDGLDLGPADYSTDSTLLGYLNSSCTGGGAMTMMMSGNYSYCDGGAMDGDHGSSTWRTSTDELCQAARKLGEWGGGI